MKTFRISTILLLCLFSTAALAQEDATAEEEMMDGEEMTTEMVVAEPVTRSLEGLYTFTFANVMKTAEMLDDELYAYRPTEDVRTAGQLLAHMATTQYYFCSTAAGEENPNGEDFEEVATTKAAIVEALQGSFAYCEGVYKAMTDAKGAEARKVFGNDLAAAGVLAFNTTHNYEHYGNLVTYMRMNGIVPPSSQQ